MATTDRYIESDLRERHNSGRKNDLKNSIRSTGYYSKCGKYYIPILETQSLIKYGF